MRCRLRCGIEVELSSASTIVFLFVGVIVLALAVIALAVWSALLSNRIKKLSDRIVYASNAQPAPRQPSQTIQGFAAATGSFASQDSTLQGTGQQMPVQQDYQLTHQSEPIQLPYQTGPTVRSIQPAVARVRTNAIQPMEEPDDDAFFESYRDMSEGHQTGAFRRERPSIPFGEDKSGAIKRENYMQDAVDTEYDPDSIDFSRVAGYKNYYNQQ